MLLNTEAKNTLYAMVFVLVHGGLATLIMVVMDGFPEKNARRFGRLPIFDIASFLAGIST